MLEKNNLKQLLINIGLCIDNEYLDLYINLLWESRNQLRQKYKTEKHHIIPKFYFNKQNKKCDNSIDNIVNLLYLDHMKAHIYLCLCCTEIYLDRATFAAHRVITGRPGFFETQVDLSDTLLLESFAKYKETWRREVGKASQNRHHNLGRITIYNPDTLKHKLILEEELNTYLELGWLKGRFFKPTEEFKLKNRLAHLGKTTSNETKLKISKANKGKHSIQPTTETKNKISTTVTKYFKTHTQVNKGKVGLYNSQTNVNIYVLPSEVDFYLQNGYILGSAKTLKRDQQKKKVICIETGIVYESATYVANMLNVVDMCVPCKNFRIKRKHNVVKKLHWAYLEDWLNLSEIEQQQYKFKISH